MDDKNKPPVRPESKLTPIVRSRTFIRPSEIEIMNQTGGSAENPPTAHHRTDTPTLSVQSEPQVFRRLFFQNMALYDLTETAHNRRLTSLDELVEVIEQSPVQEAETPAPEAKSPVTHKPKLK